MCRNVICSAQPAVRNLQCATSISLRFISVAGFALSVFTGTLCRKQASFRGFPQIPARLIANAEKNALHTYVQRANVSRYHLFLRKPLMLCLKRIFTHGKIDKQLRIFPSVTGSPVITYPSFDFSDPVQKLPSVSSIPDDLSAGGSSSLAASENVLLFLITFSYIPAILAETHYFVKPK